MVQTTDWGFLNGFALSGLWDVYRWASFIRGSKIYWKHQQLHKRIPLSSLIEYYSIRSHIGTNSLIWRIAGIKRDSLRMGLGSGRVRLIVQALEQPLLWNIVKYASKGYCSTWGADNLTIYPLFTRKGAVKVIYKSNGLRNYVNHLIYRELLPLLNVFVKYSSYCRINGSAENFSSTSKMRVAIGGLCCRSIE